MPADRTTGLPGITAMIHLADLTYHYEQDCTSLEQVLTKHKPALGFLQYLPPQLHVTVIKHLEYEGRETGNGIIYACFKSNNRFKHIPSKTHKYVKSIRPDIVLVQGLTFPIQLISLKIKLGKKTKIIAQHHGGLPARGIVGLLQRVADKCIAAYLFTAVANATPWLQANIISGKNKCFELLEAATDFTRQDRSVSRIKTNMLGEFNFVWVGRLNLNKDPITVLDAFARYLTFNPSAKLWMIYQTKELLHDIQAMLDINRHLHEAVKLVGQVDHDQLHYWYSAADFYITASYHEGSGYALIEAMSCGCIPIATNIPSFNKITANGNYGFLYPAGDRDALFKTMQKLAMIDRPVLSKAVLQYAADHLSFKAIASDLYNICKKLLAE